MLKAYFAIAKTSLPPKGKKSPVEVNLQRINEAVVEQKVYIVVETSNLKGGTISVEIQGSNEKSIVALNESLGVLEGGTEKTLFTASVGNWASKTTEYSNAASFANKTIIEILLTPASKDKLKEWRSTIGKAGNKKAYLHLKVTAQGGNQTEYSVEDDNLPSPSNENGVFLNHKDSWLNLHACYCTADVSIEILQAVGVSTARATEFLDAINSTFKSYSLNSCLKKIHFLAQTIHESGGFRLVVEGGVGEEAYGGYIGRGIMQLTTKDNYEAYEAYENANFSSIPEKDFTSSLAKKQQLEQLPYSVRSAGWYWDVKMGLNTYAAQNDFIYMTRLVNGGFNGYNDRQTNLALGFKNIYNNCINDSGKNTTYLLSTSAGNNEARACFAWGLWHDAAIGKGGCTPDTTLAIAGYSRVLQILSEDATDVDWYKIKDVAVFSNLKYTNPKTFKTHIKVREAAAQRLKILTNVK
ncbi:MAG: hypothetical protein ABI169_07730 [Chitinophagaceae bacterium]